MRRSASTARIIALAEEGRSNASIAALTSLPLPTVKNRINYWRRCLRKTGVPLPLCICGQLTNHVGRCIEKPHAAGESKSVPADFAKLASQCSTRKLRMHYRIGPVTLRRWFIDLGISSSTRGYHRITLCSAVEALAEQGWSPRTIVKETGGRSETVRRYVRLWRAKLRAAGEPVPSCRCGAAHNHLHRCTEKVGRGLRAVPPDFSEVARNCTIRSLCRIYHAANRTVSRWLAVRPDIPRPKPGPRAQALRPTYRVASNVDDSTYRLIERFIPNGYAADVRADLISALYLAVLDGTLRVDEMAERGGSILNRTLRDCGVDRWSLTISLDEAIGDNDFSLGDRLIDDAAEEAFERLFDHEEF